MTTLAPVAYGGRPKQTIIEMAFEELTISGFEFDITADEVAKALRRLNVLMAELPEMGYNFPLEEDGSASEASGLLEADLQAVVALLAVRLAPMIGKTLSPDFRSTANRSMAILRAKYATIPILDYAPLTQRGAGARGRYGTYFPPAFDEEELGVDNDPGDLAGLAGG